MGFTLPLNKNKLLFVILGILLGFLFFFAETTIAIKLVLAISIGAITLYTPIYGLAIYILAMPFISHANLLFLGSFIVIAYIFKTIKEKNFKFKNSPINIFILLFTFIISVNTITSIDPIGSLRDFSIHIVSISLIFTLIHSKKTKKDIYLLSFVFVIAATLVSFYGIYQFLTGVAMESGWVDMSQNSQINIRVFSTFENPNLLAEYLLVTIPISIAFIFYCKNIWKKLFFIASTGIMLLTIGLTYSRGGWLGLAIAITTFFLLISIKTLLLLIPFGMIGILYLPGSILQRLSTIGTLQDSSNLYRFNLWNTSVNILKDFWISGIGTGYLPFMKIFPLYMSSMAPYHTHNTFLQIAIETGLIGLIVFIGLILALIKTSITIVLQSKSKFIKIFSAAYVSALLGLSMHGLVEHILYNPKIIMTFWFIIGMIVSLYIVNKESSKEGNNESYR